MKNIFKWVLCILCLSCSQTDNNLFGDITIKGGFVEFVEIPETSFNLLNFAEAELSADITDSNNNATSYSLTLKFGDTEIDNFVTVNSFPGSFTFTGQMVLDALNITIDDLTIDSKIEFIAKVTTPNGVFLGGNPDFNSDTNTQEGGSIAPDSLETGANKSAMDFTFSFFLPPPKKLRGTSFEVPFAADDPGADYTRSDADVLKEGELFNNPGERHVMHVAAGTGVDDEIGFRAFFFDNGDSGFTNEEIGVTKKTEDVDAYIDGVQGYQIEDVDGLYRLIFDKVEIPDNFTSTGVRLQAFFRSTSWEEDDKIRIYAEVEKEGGVMETLELFSANGSGINDLEDQWNLIDSGFLDGIKSYQLIIDSELDSSSEEFYFDEVLIYIPDN